MGRRAGWLAYGASIAGEAHMVVGVEDLDLFGYTLFPVRQRFSRSLCHQGRS
jgi:hypothetical protein